MLSPEDLLTKHLAQLSGEVARYRFELRSSLSFRFAKSLSVHEQLLVARLAGVLPKIEQDPDWIEKFILLSFLLEWTTSLWGIALYHCYLGSTKSPYQITKLPACLLPMVCLICDAPLGVSRKTYQSFKRGRGKLLCQRCSDCNTQKQGFKKEEEDLPAYMQSYAGQSARRWKQATEDAFEIINQLDMLDRKENKDIVLKTVLETYRFFYSQYIASDRAYLPRYQLFCSEPVSNKWLHSLFNALSLRKAVRFRTQGASQADDILETSIQDVYVPSCFLETLDGKILNRDIQLLDLERFLNMGAGLP